MGGVAAQIISTLASIGTEETKKSGKFVIPGLVMIKTRKKPATKAAKKEMFGKTVLGKRGRRGRSSRLSPQRCSRMNSERLFFGCRGPACRLDKCVVTHGLFGRAHGMSDECTSLLL